MRRLLWPVLLLVCALSIAAVGHAYTTFPDGTAYQLAYAAAGRARIAAHEATVAARMAKAYFDGVSTLQLEIVKKFSIAPWDPVFDPCQAQIAAYLVANANGDAAGQSAFLAYVAGSTLLQGSHWAAAATAYLDAELQFQVATTHYLAAAARAQEAYSLLYALFQRLALRPAPTPGPTPAPTKAP